MHGKEQCDCDENGVLLQDKEFDDMREHESPDHFTDQMVDCDLGAPERSQNITALNGDESTTTLLESAENSILVHGCTSDDFRAQDDRDSIIILGDPNDPCPQRPKYCTGCSVMRLMMSPMAAIVFGLIGITYYAYMIETSDATILELFFFHILIALLIGYARLFISVPACTFVTFHLKMLLNDRISQNNFKLLIKQKNCLM